MPVLPEHFRLDLRPTAARDAIVRVGNARFTVLTDRLIRLEYNTEGCFEDHASQTMWFRSQPVPDFTVAHTDTGIDIETAYLHIRYTNDDHAGFTPDTLAIHLKSVDALWHPGDMDEHNLKGTTRTLDFVHGYAPLGHGLVSRSGWTVLDDSNTFVLNDDGLLQPRASRGTDLYFFGYGHDYQACLRDYAKISGQIPLLPRWLLGNWWSRFWAYTQTELEQLVSDFKAHEIPLSICIVDMDWHITKTGNTSTGWTGYTWNRELFPDPEGLIAFFHENGLHTALNLHPAEGIHPHEAQYEEMARRVGIDPETQQPIEFDITNPDFVKAYFEVLHHPYEAMGVDFWWLDWQQGLECRIAGLDPLWLINHLHFLDSGRDGVRRPFIFSRWGNEGHQRYPIGFSGDSYMTWETLRFEPYMTATAANVAYGWWSHDIGGHTSGVGDSELFTRWVQFGVFSPILRIHSTKGAFYDQRPWMFENAEVVRVLRDALQLRHAFIPYLYTMAYRAHRDCLPLMLPMYYAYPENDEAYHCPQQYLFGSELIAAPFTEAADPHTGLARQVVWLPEGDWYHFFTGERIEGNRWHVAYGALKDIPLFAKAGAIVPLGAKAGWGGIQNPDELHIHVFAGANNTFTLYEDDGETQRYLEGSGCTTTFTQQWLENHLVFTVDAPQGDTGLIPQQRTLHLYLHGVSEAANCTVTLDDAVISVTPEYNAATETLRLPNIVLGASSSLRVTLATDAPTLLHERSRQRETLLRLLLAFRLHSGVRNRIAEMLDTIIADPEALAPYAITMSDSQARALFETLYHAGIHHIADTDCPTRLILWNNREDANITYRYSDAFLYFGMVQSANHHHGTVPRFTALTPKIRTWQHGAVNEHTQQTQWHVQIDYHNLVSVSESHREQTP